MQYLLGCAAALALTGHASAAPSQSALAIPEVRDAAKRLITVDDMAALRSIDTLSISPDGRRFAIFVRQGDPVCNTYRTGWFTGSTQGGALTYAGDGGTLEVAVRPTGHVAGEMESRESHWSPDGQWIAYTLRRNGEVQLWRSRADGKLQEQLTHNAADVREFAWSADGREIYFSAGTSRVEQQEREEARSRQGYRYDEDIYDIHDFMLPVLRRPWEGDLSVWVVTLDDRRERPGGTPERVAFDRAQTRLTVGVENPEGFLQDTAVLPASRADGAVAGLVRSSKFSQHLRVMASLSPTGANPINCRAQECVGSIRKVWWSGDGKRVLFWRKEGINEHVHGFYAWSPLSGIVSLIRRAEDDDFRDCIQAVDDRLVCIGETKTRPAHVAAIDLRSGSVQVVADVNPEFRNIRLGKVERLEWDTPTFAWNEPGGKLEGLYPKRAYGYILYPPNFDAKKKYPVFIDPYVAHGFNSSAGGEHLQHVYAANGFVVLNTEFPAPVDDSGRFGESAISLTFSAELDFPDLTMLAESTIRALDVMTARGFVDGRRVGIGGVSTGTTVPLYILQKHDRIAAISISGPGWGAFEYYWGTRKEREAYISVYGKMGYEDWKPKPVGEGQKFWSRIDIADNIDTIEAPILMHLADKEAAAVIRLIRHLSDDNKAYDAYVFRRETHYKWQPSHLQAIWIRNLDWFRFWLQGHEDSDPSKEEQYSRWRTLRKQHQASLAAAGSSE